MTRILHCADVHAYYDNYGITDPGTGMNSRYLDLFRSLRFVAQTASQEKVDLAVIAGDLFKNKLPAYSSFSLIVDWLRGLADVCPVVLISGNHDVRNDQDEGPVDALYGACIPGVHIVTPPTGKRKGSGARVLHFPGLAVACLSSVSKSVLLTQEQYKDLDPVAVNHVMSDKLVDVIRGLAAQMPQTGTRILLTHSTVAGARTSSDQLINVLQEPVLPIGELAVPQFDLVCLGHIHKMQVLSKESPWIGYSGNIERVDFGEEDEPKGFFIHDTATGEHKFVEVPARKFATLEVEPGMFSEVKANLITPADAVMQTLATGTTDLRDNVVRVTIRCSKADARQINVPAVKTALLERGAHLVAGVTFDLTDDESADRKRAGDVTAAMDSMTALNRYIDAHPELGNGKRDGLVARAALLMKEVA